MTAASVALPRVGVEPSSRTQQRRDLIGL